MYKQMGVNIHTSQGMFGKISIFDFAGKRWFENNTILQAAIHIEPGTEVLGEIPSRYPGPLQGCTYTLAWLAAAHPYPKGRGLMLGLGGGEGVIAMLYNFPDLILDVVEIDPQLIGVVKEYFPAFQIFERQNRLILHNMCAQKWLLLNSTRYDFAIFDIDDTLVSVSPFLVNKDFLALFKDVALSHWFNLLTRIESSQTQQILRAFIEAGYENLDIYSCQPRTMNLLITDCTSQGTALDFTPYEFIGHESAKEVQRRYKQFIQTKQSAHKVIER